MTKSGKRVNVYSGAGDGEAISLDRRNIIKGLGFAVLTVQCLPLMVQASANPPLNGTETADGLIIQSSTGFVPHVHDVVIPYAVLKAPPLQGVAFTTTQALLHRHTLVLTQEQLKTVHQGGTITQKGGSHLFVIAMAKGQNRGHR